MAATAAAAGATTAAAAAAAAAMTAAEYSAQVEAWMRQAYHFQMMAFSESGRGGRRHRRDRLRLVPFRRLNSEFFPAPPPLI